jgi:outer membrane protein assembly factor BamA
MIRLRTYNIFRHIIKSVLLLSYCLIALNLYCQDLGKITGSIDSVLIKKNWRTKDEIILRELLLKKGDAFSEKSLRKSINRIWNIGNFADVDYKLDSLAPGSYMLTIITKDAFTLLPILSFHGNRNDYQLGLGVKDDNFLGRNISLDLVGNFGTTRNDYNVGIILPRQLLYKNMTLRFNASKGIGKNYTYLNNRMISAVAYQKWNISGSIGNPFHTDYHYTFSPNISWNLFQHKTDSTLINDLDLPRPDEYKISYLSLSINESIGLINSVRHQKNGCSASVGFGVGIGLDKDSPVFTNAGFNVAGYKLLNRIIELSAKFSSGFTTATKPSLIHYLGPGNIRGLLTGQEAGQGYYSGAIRAGFTYIYRSWFALEHSVYSHFGKASNNYFNIYRSVPRISLGTEIKIWTPLIPWLGASIHFSWLKGNKNWFYLSI